MPDIGCIVYGSVELRLCLERDETQLVGVVQGPQGHLQARHQPTSPPTILLTKQIQSFNQLFIYFNILID